MRDLVLASKYKTENNTIFFAACDLIGNLNYKIIKEGYILKVLEDNSFSKLKDLIIELKIDLLIIDHYGIDFNFEKELKLIFPHLIILSFDDTYEKHYCDILLNHNINAKESKYKNLVPPNCELRCGSKYTLLREEFISEKKKIYKSTNIEVFIGMGGADHSNINIKILEVLSKFKKIEVNLVTTNANKNLNELIQYCKNKKWINLYVNSNQIAKIIKKSHIAIVTPSVILNEVFFLEIPFIAIKTADNQKEIFNYVRKKNFFAIKRFNRNKLSLYIKKLIINKKNHRKVFRFKN